MNVASAHSDNSTSELSDIFLKGMEIANYELMVVATPGEGVDSFFKKLEDFLVGAKASKIKTERLGKKPLAYQIAKQVEGEYATFTFEAPSDVPQSLAGEMKLEQDTLLRYLITRVKKTKGTLRGSPQDSGQAVQAKVSKVSKVTNVEEVGEKPEVLEKKAVHPEGQAKVKGETKAKAIKAKKKI